MPIVQDHKESRVENENLVNGAVARGQLFLYKYPNMVATFVSDSQGVHPVCEGASKLTDEIMDAVKLDPKSKNLALTKLFECAGSTGRRIDKGRYSVVIGPQGTVPHYGYNQT
jgi:hypothetical protein